VIIDMLVAKICLCVTEKEVQDMDSTVTGLWGFDVYTT